MSLLRSSVGLSSAPSRPGNDSQPRSLADSGVRLKSGGAAHAPPRSGRGLDRLARSLGPLAEGRQDNQIPAPVHALDHEAITPTAPSLPFRPVGPTLVLSYKGRGAARVKLKAAQTAHVASRVCAAKKIRVGYRAMGRRALPRGLNQLHGSREPSALEPPDETAVEQTEQTVSDNRKLLQDARRLLAEAQAELDRYGTFVDTRRGRQANPALRVVQSQQRIVTNLIRALHLDGASSQTQSEPLIDENGMEYFPTGSKKLDDYLAEGRRIEADFARRMDAERAEEEARRARRRAARQAAKSN
jgi:hypothetical protein